MNHCLWTFIIRKNLSRLLSLLLLWAAFSGCSPGVNPESKNATRIQTNLTNNTLVFPPTKVGKYRQVSFLLFNTGKHTLSVTSLELVDNKGGAFQIVETPTLPFDITEKGKDNGIKIKVGFKAPTDNQATARIKIGSPNAENVDESGYYYVNLKSEPRVPNPMWSCNGKLQFGSVEKGKTLTKECTLSNRGSADLLIKNVAYKQEKGGTKQDFTWDTKLPVTLKADDITGITFRVTYAPSDTSPKESQGSFVLDTDWQELRLRVLGQATEPPPNNCVLDVTPQKIELDAPTSEQVTIINQGSSPCTLKKVYLNSGKNDPFSFLPAPKENLVLPPNATFLFLVTYNPTGGISYSTDSIIIESSDPNKPIIKVELLGSHGDPTRCELEAQPDTMNFSLVPVGRSSKMSVTIANKGFGNCEVSAVNVLGTNPSNNNAFQIANSVHTPLQIKSGMSIRLDVSYTPPQERSGYEGILEIKSNDAKQPNFQVKLVGSTGTPCLEIVPPNMDFGSTKFGCATPKRLIEVFNLGSSKCSSSISVTQIRIVNDKDNVFRIKSAPATPRTLAVGQSIRIELSYKAKDLGIDTATLNIQNSVAGQSPIPVPLVGEGVPTNDQKDTFKQFTRPLIDVLFIVDDSSSMKEEQTTLATNLQSFMNWMVRLNVDYHIAVTTTDTSQTGTRGPGCIRGNAHKIVTPRTPNPAATFVQNAKVGTNGSSKEQGLEAAYQALIPPASTGCNKGFYRKDASLSLILVSDGFDRSPQTVQFYLSFLKTLKKNRNLGLPSMSAIVGPPPSGCKNPGVGEASSAPRYWEVAKQLKGVRGSICAKNWFGFPSSSINFGYLKQFFLSRQADPKSIRVKVNGRPIKQDPQDGWTYDLTNNSINFSKSQVPGLGMTIQVEYQAVCLP